MNVRKIDIRKLESLDLNSIDTFSIKSITEGNFIYVLYNKETIVYIGQTRKNPENRISAHISGDKIFDRFSVFDLGGKYDKEILSSIEAHLIIKYNPIYNSSIPKSLFWVKRDKLATALGIHQKTLAKLLNSIVITDYYVHRNNTMYFDVESLRILFKKNIEC